MIHEQLWLAPVASILNPFSQTRYHFKAQLSINHDDLHNDLHNSHDSCIFMWWSSILKWFSFTLMISKRFPLILCNSHDLWWFSLILEQFLVILVIAKWFPLILIWFLSNSHWFLVILVILSDSHDSWVILIDYWLLLVILMILQRFLLIFEWFVLSLGFLVIFNWFLLISIVSQAILFMFVQFIWIFMHHHKCCIIRQSNSSSFQICMICDDS